MVADDDERPAKEDEDECDAEEDGFTCTRPYGHGGRHVAHTGPFRFCAVWGYVYNTTPQEARAELLAMEDSLRPQITDR